MAKVTKKTIDEQGNTIFDVDMEGDSQLTLATADTYVDKNIVFNIDDNYIKNGINDTSLDIEVPYVDENSYAMLELKKENGDQAVVGVAMSENSAGEDDLAAGFFVSKGSSDSSLILTSGSLKYNNKDVLVGEHYKEDLSSYGVSEHNAALIIGGDTGTHVEVYTTETYAGITAIADIEKIATDTTYATISVDSEGTINLATTDKAKYNGYEIVNTPMVAKVNIDDATDTEVLYGKENVISIQVENLGILSRETEADADNKFAFKSTTQIYYLDDIPTAKNQTVNIYTYSEETASYDLLKNVTVGTVLYKTIDKVTGYADTLDVKQHLENIKKYYINLEALDFSKATVTTIVENEHDLLEISTNNEEEILDILSSHGEFGETVPKLQTVYETYRTSVPYVLAESRIIRVLNVEHTDANLYITLSINVVSNITTHTYSSQDALLTLTADSDGKVNSISLRNDMYKGTTNARLEALEGTVPNYKHYFEDGHVGTQTLNQAHIIVQDNTEKTVGILEVKDTSTSLYTYKLDDNATEIYSTGISATETGTTIVYNDSVGLNIASTGITAVTGTNQTFTYNDVEIATVETVQANVEEESTGTLENIKIGSTVYGVSGSSDCVLKVVDGIICCEWTEEETDND